MQQEIELFQYKFVITPVSKIVDFPCLQNTYI